MADPKRIARVPAERERRSAERYTGRYLMTFEPGQTSQVVADLSQQGIQAAKPVPPGAAHAKPLPRGHHLLFPNVGIALIDPSAEHEDKLIQIASTQPAISALEPERINMGFQEEIWQPYMRGWKDAINSLYDRLMPQPAEPQAAAAEQEYTWGLTATKVPGCRFSGNGIKIAVLDTGFDQALPDFARRTIHTQNFVGDDKPFHDGVGHGTHCTGTACGPERPQKGPRYGIAYNCEIYAGRVLDDNGRGGDGNIIQGIDWAISQGCQIISLSLGAPWQPGDPPFMHAYEVAARQALAAGCLLIVAAGNDATNPLLVGAVGTPGNSPSVLTVAAVDESLATAPFSNRATPRAPGVKGPDLAGPGVGVYSCWPGGSFRTLAGTSMATPHVAGIAALYAEQNKLLRGQALKDALLQHCQALAGNASRVGEIGKGLVQAPS
jgi:subtilisin family serine protease